MGSRDIFSRTLCITFIQSSRWRIRISRYSEVYSVMRLPPILLVNFSSRRTCLCQHHENFSLLLRSVHNVDIKCSRKAYIIYSQTVCPLTWSTSSRKGFQMMKNKFQWKEVEATQLKDDFIILFMKTYGSFKLHVQRVQVQYSEILRLRDTMPEDHVLL